MVKTSGLSAWLYVRQRRIRSCRKQPERKIMVSHIYLVGERKEKMAREFKNFKFHCLVCEETKRQNFVGKATREVGG